MATTQSPSEKGEGGVDWRRLAKDRNVKPEVAKGLWERASKAGPDPKAAYMHMLEEAAHANAAPTPGKENAVDAHAKGVDKTTAPDAGPGKHTRTIMEGPAPQAAAKPDAKAGAPDAKAGAAAGPDAKAGDKKKSPDALKSELVTAVEASKNAAELIAQADPGTIVDALKLIQAGDPSLLKKLMTLAGTAVEKILGAKSTEPVDKKDIAKERTGFAVGAETHHIFIDEDGTVMMASTPKSVKDKFETEWKPRIAAFQPAAKAKIEANIVRAEGIEAQVADLAKKAKAGDKDAEKQLPKKQAELATAIQGVDFQVVDPQETLKQDGYSKFKPRFIKLATDLGMAGGEAEAQALWLEVVKTLQKSHPEYQAALDPKTTYADLTAASYQKILPEFDGIVAMLQPYMDKFCTGKQNWAFWSGKPAKDAAIGNVDVCLESSPFGALFDGININGVWDMQMWGALSKAFAANAAAKVGSMKLHGFVGFGSSREMSIFNKIEQPHFAKMLGAQQAAAPKVDWFAVAGDPKEGLGKLDKEFNGGGMPGTYKTGDRGSMVAFAESENQRRLDLWTTKQIDEGPNKKVRNPPPPPPAPVAKAPVVPPKPPVAPAAPAAKGPAAPAPAAPAPVAPPVVAAKAVDPAKDPAKAKDPAAAPVAPAADKKKEPSAAVAAAKPPAPAPAPPPAPPAPAVPAKAPPAPPAPALMAAPAPAPAAAPTPAAPAAADPAHAAPAVVPAAPPPPPGPGPAAPGPAKAPIDPKVLAKADVDLKAMFLGGKVPDAAAALKDEERIELATKPGEEVRKKYFATFDALKPAMEVTAQAKATQLDMETGLEKGAEGLPAAFKVELLGAFHTGAHGKTNFIDLFQSVATAVPGKYTMRGRQLGAADFDSAVPNDMSLSRVINVGGAFGPKNLNTGKATVEWKKENTKPGVPTPEPTSDELTAWAMQKAQLDAPTFMQEYVAHKVVEEYPSWLFPEPQIKSDAVFSEYCDLLALYANWYPQGHLRMTLQRPAVVKKVATGGLRKPTVFDGTLSALWMQRDNRDSNWGKTGGGLREALMSVSWADIDHSKWHLVAPDPKYAAILAAKKTLATPAAPQPQKDDASSAIKQHGKDMEKASVDAQAKQRAEDTAHKDPAAPITVATSMAGAPHELIANPATGKIEFNSIKGFALEKLQSIIELVPAPARHTVLTAVGKATENAALVVDPSLKAGAPQDSPRPAVVAKLGAGLKDLGAMITIVGQTGKITDADPAVVQRQREEEKARMTRMAAVSDKEDPKDADTTQNAGKVAATAPAAKDKATTKPPEVSPGSNAAKAAAPGSTAAAVAPELGGHTGSDKKAENPKNAKEAAKGRTDAQTAAVAPADPQFGGGKDDQGRATQTVAEVALAIDPNRDNHFNPIAKVEFENALSKEIMASPEIYSPQVFEVSSKVLSFFDRETKAGMMSANQKLAGMATSEDWYGHINTEMLKDPEQIGATIRQALTGKGSIPNHLATHQMFHGKILDGQWKSDIVQAFVGEAAVDPNFVRSQTKLTNGKFDKDGESVFVNGSERGRNDNTTVGGTIAAAAGTSPVEMVDKKTEKGEKTGEKERKEPAPLFAPDEKTHLGTDTGSRQKGGMVRGADRYSMDEAKAFVQRARLVANMPLIAGISGSTAELVNCAMTLGLSGESLHRYSLAVIGYINGGGNHSYIEILTVLKAAGLPVDPESYEGFYPKIFEPQFKALAAQHKDAFKKPPVTPDTTVKAKT